MTRSAQPAPPRVSAPDLPRELAKADALVPHGEAFQVRIDALPARADGSHGEITESVLAPSPLEALTLTGAVLVDVDVEDLRATTVSARGARLRRVRVSGGRIGTLDLADADLDEVELRGIRIDYLTLAGARIDDLRVADCTIGSLDVPQATAVRVAFEDTRVDDLDPRGMRAEDVDLRGLELLSVTDAAALRGTTLDIVQVERLAPFLAEALGIRVMDVGE